MNRRSFVASIVAGLAALKVWPVKAKGLRATAANHVGVIYFHDGTNRGPSYTCSWCNWTAYSTDGRGFNISHDCEAELAKWQTTPAIPPRHSHR